MLDIAGYLPRAQSPYTVSTPGRFWRMAAMPVPPAWVPDLSRYDHSAELECRGELRRVALLVDHHGRDDRAVRRHVDPSTRSRSEPESADERRSAMASNTV